MVYEPYERFDVELPDGTITSFGRLARTGVTWDDEFQVFSVNNDVEESITRSEDISMDYDFFHSQLLALSCGNDYEVKIIPKDINIWISRLFLGDADGFLFCIIRMWTALFTGQTKRLIDGNCEV